MLRKLLPACVIASLLLSSGCQSSLPTPPPVVAVATECPRPPAPDAWWMAPAEPTLTQELLNELSASPTEATGPSSR